MKLAPICVDAPVPRLPFQLALVTVTCLPLCVQVPFQPDCTVWLPVYEYCSVQLLIDGPLLVIVMATPKPVPQSLLTE